MTLFVYTLLQAFMKLQGLPEPTKFELLSEVVGDSMTVKEMAKEAKRSRSSALSRKNWLSSCPLHRGKRLSGCTLNTHELVSFSLSQVHLNHFKVVLEEVKHSESHRLIASQLLLFFKRKKSVMIQYPNAHFVL